MANLLAQDPVYITLADFRDTTTNSDLANALVVNDETLEGIIYNAQHIVDDYIQRYGTKYDIDQHYIFPIDVDWTSTLPENISIATVYVGETLYTSNSWGVATWPIKTIKSWPRTVEYFEKGVDVTPYISVQAQRILDEYRNDFFYQNV